MEIIIILGLAIWFLWAFIFGGIARADENKIEYFALCFTFLFIIVILPIIYCIIK